MSRKHIALDLTAEDVVLAPPLEAEPAVPRGAVGSVVNFVMPAAPHAIRTAKVIGVYRREQLALDVETDPDADGLPTPYRYHLVTRGLPHEPGTWH